MSTTRRGWIAGCCWLAFIAVADGREWKTQADRSYHAEFVSADDEQVTLLQPNGDEITLPRAQLSVGDQAFLAAWLKPVEVDDTPPPAGRPIDAPGYEPNGLQPRKDLANYYGLRLADGSVMTEQRMQELSPNERIGLLHVSRFSEVTRLRTLETFLRARRSAQAEIAKEEAEGKSLELYLLLRPDTQLRVTAASLNRLKIEDRLWLLQRADPDKPWQLESARGYLSGLHQSNETDRKREAEALLEAERENAAKAAGRAEQLRAANERK